MGVKVECLNATQERLNEFQMEVERLWAQGLRKARLQHYLANRYMCGVSITYRRDDVIYNLHPLQF